MRAAATRRALARASLLAFVSLFGAGACDKKPSADSEATAAVASAIGLSECAACGMVVREQPAPRGQVVHRDGTRVFLCSLADLVQYLQAPSKHGSPVSVFVEVLDPAAAPKEKSTAERPWARAEEAGYVVGVEREGIMGKPVLAYPSAAAAAAAAARHGGQQKSWSELPAWILER